MSAQFPDYVCKLKKVVYGLKQAPRGGFKRSNNNVSMMIYNHDGVFVMILMYVDDILTIGTNNDFISALTSKINDAVFKRLRRTMFLPRNGSSKNLRRLSFKPNQVYQESS